MSTDRRGEQWHDEAVTLVDYDLGCPSCSPPRYRCAPYRPEEMHWFCKPDPARRTHHLHLVPTGSARYLDE